VFGLKAPVWHLDAGDQHASGLILGIGAVIGAVYVLRVARQERKVYPLYLLVGGVLTVFIEPFVDVLGHCAWPSLHMTQYVKTFGVSIPLEQAPTYVLYFAPAIVFLMRRLERGISMKTWWIYYAVGVGAALLFELEPVHRGWWRYYGANQPFDLWGLPLWWAWVNVSSTLLAGATFWVIVRKRLIEPRFQIAFVPLVTVVVTAFHTLAAMPVYTAINSSPHVAVTDLAALLTVGIAVLSVYVGGRLVTEQPDGPLAEPAVGIRVDDVSVARQTGVPA
jgi:hypothetical protein